jgi:type IV pilus assembly protein PilX
MTHATPARGMRLPPAGAALGIALVTAMIALAVMALAAAALVRAVSTATAVSGNLALRTASIPAADAAIEDAIAALADPAAIAEPQRDDPAWNYYASRQPGEDPRGIPWLLQRPDRYPANWRTVAAGEGSVARYMIERLCMAPGAPVRANCPLARDSARAGPPPEMPLYRITARVDGPRGTTSLVQAIVRDARTPRRLAWRVVPD